MKEEKLKRAIEYGIAVGEDEDIIKRALRRLNMPEDYQKMEKPFTLEEWGEKIGIKAVNSVIEPIKWSDGLWEVYNEGKLSKMLCREVRIYSESPYHERGIADILIKIIDSGIKIDRAKLNKFFKIVKYDTISFEFFEILLIKTFDIDSEKLSIDNMEAKKICDDVCNVFRFKPDDFYVLSDD